MAEEEQHEDTDYKSQASSSCGDKHGIVKKPRSVGLRLPRKYIYSNIFLDIDKWQVTFVLDNPHLRL